MKDFKLSSKDPIVIFEFHSRVIEETDVHDMEKGQIMACLQHKLAKTLSRPQIKVMQVVYDHGLRTYSTSWRHRRRKPQYAKQPILLHHY